MALPFHLPVTAAQVGTYFVGQCYQVLQQLPELVHQLYSEASTLLRVDGNTREAASAMLWFGGRVIVPDHASPRVRTSA